MRVDELISIIDKIRGVKVCLLVIGKTDAEFVRAGIAEYEKRLKYYIPYEMKVIPDVRNTKNMSEIQQKKRVHFKGFRGLFGTEDADKYEATCIYHRGTLRFFGRSI